MLNIPNYKYKHVARRNYLCYRGISGLHLALSLWQPEFNSTSQVPNWSLKSWIVT